MFHVKSFRLFPGLSCCFITLCVWHFEGKKAFLFWKQSVNDSQFDKTVHICNGGSETDGGGLCFHCWSKVGYELVCTVKTCLKWTKQIRTPTCQRVFFQLWPGTENHDHTQVQVACLHQHPCERGAQEIKQSDRYDCTKHLQTMVWNIQICHNYTGRVIRGDGVMAWGKRL